MAAKRDSRRLGFVAALQFLTIIPLRRAVDTEEVGRSLAYFPLVGLVIGGFLYGLDRLLGLALPLGIVNVFLVIALVIITRALHLDGFVDTCDGIAGGGSSAARLKIMRDSRIGSFGAAGVFCLLLLKYMSLSFMPDGQRMAALILMPTLARWTMSYAVFAYPYARKGQGLGVIFKEQANWLRVTIATLIALASSVALMGPEGLAVMASAWLVALALATYLNRKLGGLTGDSYGAVNEVVEVAVLLLIPFITWSYGV
ncbi:MAG: adenosylcobinamide-GDP ribazoletransferase [Dehalococcoidia bacterium]